MISSKNVFTFEKELHLSMKDNDIIRGIRENSEYAWRALYAATHDKFAPLISSILKRKSETEYEDIYEQACIDLMDNVKDGRLKESENVNLSGYLYTICMRRAVRAEERRKTEEKRMHELFVGSIEEEGQQIEQDAVDEALAFLDKVLAGIPESCRAILRRFYWDKMSMMDIAAAMGLKNDDVAKATKNKCMNKFKSVAREMLADDEKAEEAVRRAVERDALRDLLEGFRKESSGEWARAALDDKDEKKD